MKAEISNIADQNAKRFTSVVYQLARMRTDWYTTLAPDCSGEITRGAEDDGEMGTYHAWRFVAQREALRRKLKEYLPLGIEPVIIWDKRLLCAPPRKKVKKENEE